MTAADWQSGERPADTLRALSAHRLLPVASLLVERGLLRGDLLPAAERLTVRIRDEMLQRLAIEDEVLAAVASAGIPCLVHKGALLGRTVYPASWQRLRLDLDLAVEARLMGRVSEVLRDLRFQPRFEVEGGPPAMQAQWVRRTGEVPHSVDLHWGLFNDPLLKNRFGLGELLRRSVPLSRPEGPVSGLAAPDSLLHAAAHYFGHHRGEFRPDQWLLDMDLLWRAMDDVQRDRIGEQALEIGVGSLLAAGLRLAEARFATPLDPARLDRLDHASRREKARRLTRPPGPRIVEVLRSAMDERGWGQRARYFRAALLPPAAHMRTKYPDAPRWALPWLYVRRVLDGARRRPP